MPVYKYNNDYVDIENISINEEVGYRYSMFVPFKNSENEKYILVIMRNPSKACKINSDKTVNNVLRFCKDEYKGVYIANLYPYYQTDSKQLKDFIESDSYEEKMKKNTRATDTLLNNNNIDEVIVAWGTNNSGQKYNKDYESTLKNFSSKLNMANKKVYAMRFTKSKNPWHPRNWEKSFELELYPWGNNI